jgi:hypothetical protein
LGLTGTEVTRNFSGTDVNDYHDAGYSVIESCAMRIANAKGVPGTAGALVRPRDHRDHPDVLALTTWHTLFAGMASWQDAVWLVTDARGDARHRQLGRTLAGKIGTVRVHGVDYFVDCAVVSLFEMPSSNVASSLPTIASTDRARVGRHVIKSGAATGVTQGIVVDIDYACDVQIHSGLQRAGRQLLVRAAQDGQRFADAGDSGALVVDASNRAIGLLWGNTPQGDGVACPIDAVLAALDITFRADTV